MIKVSQQIRVYEENDKEIPLGQQRHISVESHWNWNERVILEIGKERITVIGRDLKVAIDNAMNTNR
jgi:hypothetical protein